MSTLVKRDVEIQVRHMLPGIPAEEWPVETYRRYFWPDIVCARANMAAHPSQIIGSTVLDMTEEQACAFEIVVAFARVRAKKEYKPLRQSV